jgi:hypothetical protein
MQRVKHRCMSQQRQVMLLLLLRWQQQGQM